MLAGPGINRDQLLQHPYVVEQNAEDLVGQRTVEPTTDDWPFLYPQERGFPMTYASIRNEQIPGAALGYNLFGAIVGGVLGLGDQ